MEILKNNFNGTIEKIIKDLISKKINYFSKKKKFN